MFSRFGRDVRGMHPFILPVILSFSIYNFGWGFADPFFSVYLGAFANHFAMIGFLNTLYVVLALVVLVPLSRLLDTTNHYAISYAAKIGYAICGLLYFLAGEYRALWILVIALLWNGFVISFVWTTASATLRIFSQKKNASLVYGLFFSSRNLAWLAGTLCALGLIQFFPLHYMFLAVTATSLISMLPTWRLLPTHHLTLWQGIKTLHIKNIYREFVRDIRSFSVEMWWMYGIYFTGYIIQVFWFTYVPLYMEALGFSLAEIGMYVIACTVPFVFSFIAAEISDRSERLRTVMIGFVFSGLITILLAFVSHTYVVFLVLGFLSITGFAIALPAMSAVITLASPKRERGAATALLDMMMFGSILVSSPIIGRSIDIFGWLATCVIVGTVLVSIGVLVLLLKQRWNNQNMLYHINHPSSKKQPYII